MDERKEMLEAMTSELDNVTIDIFEACWCTYCIQKNANAVLRGIRAVSDYEFELQMALMNRKMEPRVETVFMMPAEKYSYLSSRIVREIAKLGGPLTGLVPEMVEERVRREDRARNNRHPQERISNEGPNHDRCRNSALLVSHQPHSAHRGLGHHGGCRPKPRSCAPTGADLVDFGAGEPHFATPQHIKEAAIAAIQNNFTKYTAVGGTAELRDAIIKRHAADFGSDYKREDCIASVGGKHALFNAIQVLVDHGDEVILPVPYWVSFKDIVRYAGGEPVYIATDERHDFALTADMVERAITPRTKVIVLNSPSNPSGAVMKPEAHGVGAEAGARSRHLCRLRRVLRVSELHRPTVLGGLRPRSEGAPDHHRLALEDLCHDRLAPGLCAGPCADHQRHAEAAKPEHVESDFDRAEGGGRGSDRLAGLREADAGRIHLAARQSRGGLARDSRPYLRIAERRFLCLSERQPLFRVAAG